MLAISRPGLNMLLPRTYIATLVCLTVLACPSFPSRATNPLQQALDIRRQGQQEAIRTQQAVESSEQERQALRRRYLQALGQIDVHRASNEELKARIADQAQHLEITALEQQDADILTRRVTPIMRRMVEVLESFLSLDLPFLLPQRRERVAALYQALENPDVTLTEGFQRITEIYQAELEYGYRLEAFSGVLESSQGQQAVEFLRVGRLGLYYLASDRNTAGYWDREIGGWQQLSNDFLPTLARGIQIAREQIPVELIALPVTAPVISR